MNSRLARLAPLALLLASGAAPAPAETSAATPATPPARADALAAGCGLGVNLPLVGRIVGAGNTLYTSTLDVSNDGATDAQVDFYLDGRLNLDAMISRRLKLDDINSAFAELKRGEVARSVIMFDA